MAASLPTDSPVIADQTPATTFRLIHSAPLAGADNMALDEAILEAVAAGEAPPTLRLYAWHPPCLSLGYAQPAGDVDRERLDQAGWDLVRRPTGGKAILHTDELTYSIAGPADHPLLAGDVLNSYRRLSAGLLQAVRSFGPEPAVQAGASSHGGNPICFQDPGAYELTVHGQKLIGSAQVRRARAVLQHGSLPLAGDIARICQALHYPGETQREQAAAGVRRAATTLERAAGRAVSWEQAATALAEGFRLGLKLQLRPAEPTPQERQRAEALARTKYRSAEWNLRL